MEDDDQLCFADAEEDEDELRPELQQEFRHLRAQHRADCQQQQEEGHVSRARRSAATGPRRGRAAPRRAAGEPAQSQPQRRQRRRYTSSLADAADSYNFAGVDEGYMDATAAPQEPDADEDVLESFLTQLAADAAAAAEHEPDWGSDGEEASEWSQRSARAEAAWRQQAPLLGAAVLQAAAAPDPQQMCSVCGAEQGCTVRYVLSNPVTSVPQLQPGVTATQSNMGLVLSMHPTVTLVRVSFVLQVLVMFTSCRVYSAVQCLRPRSA